MGAAHTPAQPPSAVEVRFRPARHLVVTQPSGGSDTTYSNVIAVFGKIRNMKGDTVWVTASEIRFPTSRISFSRSGSPTAVVVRAEGATVRRFNSELGNAVLGAGIGAAIGAAYAFALIIALLSGAST